MKKAAVALLLVLALGPVALAQISKLTIKVAGMACPFCAYGLEKEVKRVPGVSRVKADFAKGQAEVTVKKGQPLDIDAMEEAVKKGGFTPGEMDVEATGRIEQWNGRPALIIPGTDERFLLAENANLQKLKSQTGRTVTVAGQLKKETPRGHHAHPYTLTIERVQTGS